MEFRWSGVPFLVQAVLITDSSAVAAEVAAAMAQPPYDTPAAAAAVTAGARGPVSATRFAAKAELVRAEGDSMQTDGWSVQGDEGEVPGPRRWAHGDRSCEELLLDLGTWAYHAARAGVLTHTPQGAAGGPAAEAGVGHGRSSSCISSPYHMPRQASSDTWGGSECSPHSGNAGAPYSNSSSSTLSGNSTNSRATTSMGTGCPSLQLHLGEDVGPGEGQRRGPGHREVPRDGPPLADLLGLGQHLLGYARECGWAGVEVWVWAGLMQLQLQGCATGRCVGVDGYPYGAVGAAEGGQGEPAWAGAASGGVAGAAGAAGNSAGERRTGSGVAFEGSTALQAAGTAGATGQVVGVDTRAEPEAEAGRQKRINGWRVQAQ